jgi:hypothetical protein
MSLEMLIVITLHQEIYRKENNHCHSVNV